MKSYIQLCCLCLLGFLTSCSTSKNVATTQSSTSQRESSNDPVFLDNVSITPGSQRTIFAETGKRKKKYTPPEHTNSNFNIENATPVQIKYATMLDVPVEELTNTKLLHHINYWWGTKYCLGGYTEDCTDCSAFTQNIFRDVYAFSIPRTAQEQYNNSAPIDTRELQQGDLVFFQTYGKNISHVGIYIANNKFAHASVSNGVTISDLNEAYWKQRHKGGGRFVK